MNPPIVYITADQTILSCIDNQTVQVRYDPPDCRILGCHYDKKSRHKQLLSTWRLYTRHLSETIPFDLSTQDWAPSTIVAHDTYLKVLYKPMFRGHYWTSLDSDSTSLCYSISHRTYSLVSLALRANSITVWRLFWTIYQLLCYKWTWISIKWPNGPHQADFRTV
jgi:hypothetical protein